MSAAPGAPLPPLSVPLLSGGTRHFGPGEAGWSMLVVYRGRHCPRCKTYLSKLSGMLAAFADLGVTVTVTSADPPERAEADRIEYGWTFDLGHSLSLADMAALGLYVSDPTGPQETDRPFAEPGLFIVNPDGLLHVVGLSNAASCRPDLDVVLDGIGGIQTKGLPIRGRRSTEGVV
ncbi:MAG: redoxin domain-containing protein [Pseudomonadota bacterium]